jgi:hypothetical protein
VIPFTAISDPFTAISDNDNIIEVAISNTLIDF